jgi:hypothetical protein
MRENPANSQLSRYMRQPAPILYSEGIVGKDRLNQRRAKHVVHVVPPKPTSYGVPSEAEVRRSLLSLPC